MNKEELVTNVVKEYMDCGLTQEKLMEAGKDGLKKAEEKYDPKADFSFDAYAVWWIGQRIIQALESKK